MVLPGWGGDRIVIEGTGDSQSLLRRLAQAFEQRHPGTTVEVPDSIDSAGGIKATARGECDLGRIARPLKAREREYGLNYRLFAYSPVVFAANLPSKCLDSLSPDQVRGIFSGKIRDWAELGECEEHKIYVAVREEGDSSRQVVEREIAGIAAEGARAGKMLYSTPETVQVLAEHPHTIAYLPLAAISKVDVTVLGIDGVSPSEKNVQGGKYRLVSPFGLVWRGELSGTSRIFVDFIFSAEGRQIIRAEGGWPVEGR